jgi:hypothetical protein
LKQTKLKQIFYIDFFLSRVACVVFDVPKVPDRGEITLGGLPRRHFEPNMNAVRRKVNSE